MNNRELKLKTVYKHFKGNLYYTEDIVIDTATDKVRVLYRALYGDRGLYVRDVEEFLSLTDIVKYPNAEQKYRFEEC